MKPISSARLEKTNVLSRKIFLVHCMHLRYNFFKLNFELFEFVCVAHIYYLHSVKGLCSESEMITKEDFCKWRERNAITLNLLKLKLETSQTGLRCTVCAQFKICTN